MSITQSLRYGAAELKRLYNRNLALALVISVGVHFALILLYLCVANVYAGDDKGKLDGNKVVVDYVLPPTTPPVSQDVETPVPDIPQPLVEGEGKGGSAARMDEMAGKAIGVADELVNDSLDFAPLDRIAITLAQPNDSPGGGGLGNGDSNGILGSGGPVSIPAKSRENVDEIPSPTDFVEVEKEPVFDMDELYRRIHYPEMARKNGIEGKVVVQVYVDKTGRPVRTQIAMSDNKLLEDAAVNAIMEVRFTPAIQNQIPIGVWVAIPVVFSLK